MHKNGTFSFSVADSENGTRLDIFLSIHLENCSRARAGLLIRNGYVRVDAIPRKPAYRLSDGEIVDGILPAPEPMVHKPEALPLDIHYEDDQLVVINKPAGRVVHPAPGHGSGTLVNAVLYHCPQIEGIGGVFRPGIVHRLDKDTSGLIVIAKTEVSHHGLARQFKDRTVRKTYLALVCGRFEADGGTIERPISRHPVERKKMSTLNPNGRPAVTRWKVRERFPVATLLELDLKTGRTHQIRVHCAAEGYPLIGDTVYGGRRLKAWTREVESRFPGMEGRLDCRQMLHAWRLGFRHPVSGLDLNFEVGPPEDICDLLERLRGLS